MRKRRRSRPFRVAAVAVPFIAVGVAIGLLREPTISAVHAVTRGDSTADTVTGVLLLVIPTAAIYGGDYLTQRRQWRYPWHWWLALLFLPAIELLPSGRYFTSTSLQREVQHRLPGCYAGLLAGLLLTVIMLPVLGISASNRRKARAGADGKRDSSMANLTDAAARG